MLFFADVIRGNSKKNPKTDNATLRTGLVVLQNCISLK